MNRTFSTEELLNSLKTDKFIMHSNITMGYVPGLPILCILNGNLCMKVPYLKYKVTGEVDKTFVYPTKFVVTIAIPEQVIVKIEDLAYDKSFSSVEFNNPVGLFRHDAIKDLDKRTYTNMRKELYAEYDRIINHLTSNGTYETNDELRFKSLLNTILEPSLHPFYQAIDSEFSNKYIIQSKQS